MSVIITALGWAGAFSALAAYYLVSSKRVAPDSFAYHGLNISGSTLLALACAWTAAWPSFVTNIVFITLGLRMLFIAKRALVTAYLRRTRSAMIKVPHKFLHRDHSGAANDAVAATLVPVNEVNPKFSERIETMPHLPKVPALNRWVKLLQRPVNDELRAERRARLTTRSYRVAQPMAVTQTYQHGLAATPASY